MRRIMKKLFLVVILAATVISTTGIPITKTQAATASKVTLDKSSMIIGIGKLNAKTLKATVTGSKKTLIFESSNKKVATVTQNGKVTGVSKGEAVITCRIKDTKAKADCKITVRELVKTITMDEPYINFNKKGEKFQIKVSIAPTNATVKKVTYTSANNKVAKVNSKGLVTAVGPGSTTISVKATDGSNKALLIKVKYIDGKYDAPAGFDANRKDVAKGKTTEITYYSSVTNSNRPALVYTPAGYSKDKKYNVCYLLHGGGCDEYQWNSYSVGSILENLYADKSADVKDMILVMPNCNINESVDGSTDRTMNFENDLVNCLMPYIEKNYSVATGREHTALCGLSMGGGLTASIGLDRIDLFGYLAILSAAPSDRVAKYTENLEDETHKLYPPKVIWVSTGSADTLVAGSIQSMRNEFEKPEVQKYFKDNNTIYTFYEMPTTVSHSDPEWRNGFYNFAKLIFK